MDFLKITNQNWEDVSHNTQSKKITQQRYNYTDLKIIQTVALELDNRLLWSYHRCKLCPYKTKRYELMTKHLTRHKVTKKSKMFNCMGASMDRYKCSLCTFKTPLLVSFNKHIEMFHGGGPSIKSEYLDFLNLFKTYSCDKCTFKSASQYLYIKHYSKCPLVKFLSKRKIYKTTTKEGEYEVEIVEKFDTYDCSMCPFTTKRRIMLDRHLESKHLFPNMNMEQSKNYASCIYCPYTSKFQHEIKRHLKVHRNGPNNYKKIYCEYCPFSTDVQPKGLLNHYLVVHLDKLDVKFPVPLEKKEPVATQEKNEDTLVPTNEKIQARKRSKHVQMTKKPPKKPSSKFTCTKCNFSTSYITAYQNHLKFRHASETAWIYCNQCSYKTVFENKLEKHTKVSHQPKKYWQCRSCHHRIPLDRNLQKEQQAHKEKCKNTDSIAIPSHKTILKCDSCDYKSHIKKKFREHKCERKSVRSKAQPFEEVIAAPVSRVLSTWYHCDVGDFKTKDHSLLIEHILKKHVSYKLVICHKCELCEFRTIEEEELKKHVSDVHVDPQYTDWIQCDICPDKFKNDVELKAHVMTKHIL